MLGEVLSILKITIDHLKAITNRRYAAKTKSAIRKIVYASRDVHEINVLHEDDGSCCKVQSWPITASRLMSPSIAELSGADEQNLQAQWAEHEPPIVMVKKRPE